MSPHISLNHHLTTSQRDYIYMNDNVHGGCMDVYIYIQIHSLFPFVMCISSCAYKSVPEEQLQTVQYLQSLGKHTNSNK